MHIEVCPNSYFWWCFISENPWVSFPIDYESSVKGTKNYFKDMCLIHSQISDFTSLFYSMNYHNIKSYIHKLDNFETKKFLNVSFTDVCGICSDFVVSETFLELNCHGILALCETNLNHSFDSNNFSLKGNPWILKDYITHMNGLAVFLRKGMHSACDSSLKTLVILVYSKIQY